jgi:hypothetical protein
VEYYHPTDRGHEAEIKARLEENVVEVLERYVDVTLRSVRAGLMTSWRMPGGSLL